MCVNADGVKPGLKEGGRTSVILFMILPILIAIIYHMIDANPMLILYDIILTATTSNRFKAYRGKSVWVTGASSGIGAEFVCQLAEAGAGHVILSARRVDKLNEVAHECRQRSGNDGATVFSIVPYDAMDPDAAEATVEKALEGGPIDMLILNAGIYHIQPALQTPRDESRRVMRVNYESGVELFNALVRLDKWKERGYGQVLAIASVASYVNVPLLSSYAASKHAMRAYFDTVAAEESSWLRTDVTCPGPVANTGIWKEVGGKSIEGGQVTVQRAVKLILTGTVGPSLLFFETMVGRADTQIAALIKLYIPTIYHALQPLAARIRLAIWERERVDEHSFVGLIYGVFHIVLGKL